MTYPKPKGLTYTQMAQWVDQNGSTTDCDEDKLCQCLFHLVCLKAQQFGYFNDIEQLDDFCVFCTSKLFHRIRVDKNLVVIKSITNYIKNVIGPWRADYIKSFCAGSDEANIADFDVVDYSDYLIDVASEQDYHAFYVECFKVSDVILKYLKRIPRRKNTPEWSNIYVSCLLTLHDRIKYAATITSREDALKEPQQTDRLIRGLKKTPPILFHVDECYSNYITTLVNEIIHALAAELTYTTHSKVSVGACMRNLVAAASNDEDD